MIILVNNDKDAFELCFKAASRLVGDTDIKYDKVHKAFVRKNNGKVVVSFAGILRAIKFSKLIGLDVSRAYFFAAKLISSNTDSKKDKLLFGAKLFGLAVLGVSLALPVLSLMSSIALVSFLLNLPSYCLAYLISRIIIPCMKNVIPGFNDYLNNLKNQKIVETKYREANISREEVLHYLLILLVSFLYMPLYIFIPFIIMLYTFRPGKLVLHPITCLTNISRHIISRLYKTADAYDKLDYTLCKAVEEAQNKTQNFTIESLLEGLLCTTPPITESDFYSILRFVISKKSTLEEKKEEEEIITDLQDNDAAHPKTAMDASGSDPSTPKQTPKQQETTV